MALAQDMILAGALWWLLSAAAGAEEEGLHTPRLMPTPAAPPVNQTTTEDLREVIARAKRSMAERAKAIEKFEANAREALDTDPTEPTR